ncbi:MAG: glycosyltransferase family 4 protein, partial [Bryobacteraceae bacterium]
MKILFLDQFSEMGGAQFCLLDLLPALWERGWRAHAAVPAIGSLVERLQAHGVGVDQIPCGPYRAGRKRVGDFARFALDAVRQRAAIAALVERGGFDLLYVNGPRVLPAAALAARARVPVLFHAHNHIDSGYAVRLAGWSIRRSNATVVACSRFVAAPLAGYAAAGRLHVVPSGTPDLGFREPRPDPAAPWRIGIIGRISPEKGTAEFVRAAALCSGIPGIRFVVCGAPANGRYSDMVAAAALRLPIDFLGWRDDVATVLRNLDLLVLASRREGLGRVMLEAFSAGVPVVAFPEGGIVEAIEDEETGFLTTEPSAAALAARLSELIRGDSRRLRNVAVNARWLWQRSYRLAMYQQRITDTIRRMVSPSFPERETA